MKSTYLVLFILLLSLSGFTQSIYFKFNDETKAEFALNSIKTITYTENKININKTNDSVISYEISNINQINYKGFPSAVIDYSAQNINLAVYPNPSNGPLEIAYQVTTTSQTSIEIVDFQGRIIKNLFSGETIPGNHKIKWDLTNNEGHQVSSGSYICRMYQGKDFTTKNIIIQK